MIKKVGEKTDAIIHSQNKSAKRGATKIHVSERRKGTIRWPRSGRLSREVRVTAIELVVEEMAESNDWKTLATTLSKLVGVQKFQIHPKKGVLVLQFNQDQVNLRKIQYILRNYGYEIKPASGSEPMEQKIPLPLQSI